MNKKQFSLLLASMMAVHSVAFSAVIESPIDKIKAAAQNVDVKDLENLVDASDAKTVGEMITTYKQVQQMAVSLRSIQDGNEQDVILKWANKAQVVLVGASAIAINSHLKATEKKSYALQLAAASALLNTFIRHYSEVKNLKPSEMGVFLTGFTHEMTQNKMLTPEMVEMANTLNQISSDLISQKSQIDSVVSKLGGGSDIATGALILLSVGQYVAPKLAKDGEAILKTLSQKMTAGASNLSQSSKVVGVSGGAAGLPDLLGISLGMDTTKSQEMIALTLNKLDTAARKLESQIAQKK